MRADEFGIARSIEPKASLPQPAWKIDNTMILRPSEILIDVKIININLVSFNEILEEAEFQEEQIKKRIVDIIEERGKLHNPVTGTGGMFYGKVLEMGEEYPNSYGLAVGDEVVSLTSLSLTPIKLEKIIAIDYEASQLEVEAKCILFANSPVIKKPEDLPLKLVVYALDEAGAPCRTNQIVKKNQNVLILGANGKIGLLCAYAARDRLAGTGKLIGIVKTAQSKEQVEKYKIFDQVLQVDASNVVDFYELEDSHIEGYDIVINCVNSPSTELACLLAVKDKGVIYFASLSSDYKLTSLTAEGIGKEITLIPYTGFLEGHADYTLNLLRKYVELQDVLQYKTNTTTRQNSLQRSIQADGQWDELKQTESYIFASDESRMTLRKTLKVSQYNSNVLIYGESGVGKEIIAKIIHQNSTRKSFPLIKINCASIPENLLESELFGYEKGSFTGANTTGKVGLWEAAQNGTLFLDEIGELPLGFQAKLLRAIQEKEIIRVGGILPIKVDVRIIAASNKNLTHLMRQGLFREDLYYRINVFPITIRPLRERKGDIIPLINWFSKMYNEEFKTDVVLTKQAKEYLTNYSFRGNVRELQNLIQRIIINTDKQVVDIRDVVQAMSYDREETPEALSQKYSPDSLGRQGSNYLETRVSLKEILCETEEAVMREYKRMYGSTRQIAEVLGISQSSVVRKLHQYGLESSDS
jgi:TyrR family helix-turn-helix protein